MGIFDPATSQATLTQQSNWTPEQKALFAQLIQQTQTGLTQGSTAYPGATSAPQNPLESAYFGSAQLSPESVMSRENALRSILSGQPAYTVDQGAYNQAQSYMTNAYPGRTTDPLQQAARTSILGGVPSYTVDPTQRNAYYQSTFYDPAMREYQQDILPQVLERASGTGFHSSDTLNQMGKSGTDLETYLASQRANLLWQDIQSGYAAEESAAGRQATLLGAEQGIGATLGGAQGQLAWNAELARQAPFESAAASKAAMAGSPTNIMTGYTQQLGTAGTYARQIEQEKIQGDLARWLSGETMGGVSNTAYNPNTQLALALLGLAPYSYGSNVEAEGAGAGYGFLQGAASGAGSAATQALINALFG